MNKQEEITESSRKSGVCCCGRHYLWGGMPCVYHDEVCKKEKWRHEDLRKVKGAAVQKGEGK